MKRRLSITLAVLAVLEIATLGILLGNLATVHNADLARVIGPIHGAVYLLVVLIGLLTPGWRWSTRLLGLIPVVGGIFAAIRMRRERKSGHDARPTSSAV